LFKLKFRLTFVIRHLNMRDVTNDITDMNVNVSPTQLDLIR